MFERLVKVKSVWELMYESVIENVRWVMILENLVVLFRKDTFRSIVGNEIYYPQETPGCRYYIKPNDGSCGKDIRIVENKLFEDIVGYTICPEIITPLIGGKYKYDYRVWVVVNSDLTYFICPTFIKRVSLVEFDIKQTYGSLTNISLYSKIIECQDERIFNSVNFIIQNTLKKLNPISNDTFMLTGWDFIEDIHGNIFVLEVNCNPGINIEYTQTFSEFLNHINTHS